MRACVLNLSLYADMVVPANVMCLILHRCSFAPLFIRLGAVAKSGIQFDGNAPANLTFVIEGAPKGFFIDQSSGELTGSPRSEVR